MDKYVETENGTLAALEAYEIESPNAENVASSIANENLTKPEIISAVEIAQENLKSALIKQGITPTKIAKKVDELLEATRGTLFGEVPDYQARDKGIKHATNIFGIEDLDKPKSDTTYNFIFNSETQAEIKKIEEVIKAKLINPDVQTNQEDSKTES